MNCRVIKIIVFLSIVAASLLRAQSARNKIPTCGKGGALIDCEVKYYDNKGHVIKSSFGLDFIEYPLPTGKDTLKYFNVFANGHLPRSIQCFPERTPVPDTVFLDKIISGNTYVLNDLTFNEAGALLSDPSKPAVDCYAYFMKAEKTFTFKILINSSNVQQLKNAEMLVKLITLRNPTLSGKIQIAKTDSSLTTKGICLKIEKT